MIIVMMSLLILVRLRWHGVTGDSESSFTMTFEYFKGMVTFCQ